MRRPLLLTVIGLIAFSTVVPSARGASSPALSPAAQSLARCVQQNGRLSVVMLIDESGSLSTTDPYNQRVNGIRAALIGLANLADAPAGEGGAEVSVLMAGFFGKVRPDPEGGIPPDAWRPVSHENVDSLLKEAGRYAALNQGRATDYATALTAARRMLAERTAEETSADGGACKALIWFTDGRYSLPQRVGKSGVGLPLTVPYAPGVRLDRKGAGRQAVEAGKRFMCKPNGLMDGLQREGVVRFTVALSTKLSAADADFLDAATTGRSHQVECGAHVSPLSGEYLTARDGDRLLFAFANVLSTETPIKVRPICDELECVRGETSFTTVSGLSRFLIRASAGRGSGAVARSHPELRLSAPNGESVTLSPGGSAVLRLSGAEITQRWVSDRAVELEGSFESDKEGWLGNWSYALADPSAGRRDRGLSSVQLFTDLEPAVVGSPTLIRGVSTRLKFDLTTGGDADAVTHTGPLVRSARLSATIDEPVASRSTPVRVSGPDEDGGFSALVTVPDSSTAGFVYLGLTASFSTPSGTPIASQYRAFNLPVGLPPNQGYPTVSPASLDLPSLQGQGTAEGVLTVTGSAASAGCVWVGEGPVAAPSAAGDIKPVIAPAAGDSQHCIPIGKGESRELRIELTPADEASGSVSVELPVHLRSDLVDRDRVVSVPLSFSMTRAPDAKTWIVFALLIAAGALFPLLLLHLLNFASGRFTAPNQLRALALPVEMQRNGRLRSPGVADGSPIERGGSLSDKGGAPVRDLDFEGVHFHAVASGSRKDGTFVLFRGPYGIATANGAKVVAGSEGHRLRSWRDGEASEVPLSLAGTWVLRVGGVRRPVSGPASPAQARVSESATLAGDDRFFANPASTAPVEPAGHDRNEAAREPMLEGTLILISSDVHPNQNEALFREAGEVLGERDDLWETGDTAGAEEETAAERGRDENEQKAGDFPWEQGGPAQSVKRDSKDDFF